MGYFIHIPTSGGKAGKGCAKTSNYQVRWRGDGVESIVKQFRFNTNDPKSRAVASARAKDYVQQMNDRDRFHTHIDPTQSLG